MKKLSQLLAILLGFSLFLAVSLFLSSCSKDDEKPASSFTYDGKSHSTPKGYISLEFEETGIYEKSVILSSKSFEQMLSSSSDFVSLSLLTNNEDLTIPDGTYTYGEDWENFKFNWVTLGVGFNILSEEGELNEDMTAGSVIVSQGGKKFEFDITFANGKKATGTFSGSLESID